MLRLSENPPPRLANRESVLDIPGDWYIGHCRSRLEKGFAHDLGRLGIDYYLPLIPRTSFSGGRKRKSLHPLFPSYVFFAGDESARLAALRTDRLANVLSVREPEDLVEQLSAVERALSSDLDVALYQSLAVGQQCRIRAGPLKGVVGVVVARADGATFVIEVALLHQSAAIRIDADLLEALAEDRVGSVEEVMSE